MASHGTLPLYYKNSKPTGLSAGPGKSWKDNYLLVVVFVGFVILIAGTFWFLPPLDDKDSDYEKTYGRFTGNAAITDAVIPTEPTLVPSSDQEQGGEGRGGNGEGLGEAIAGNGLGAVNQPIHIEDPIGEQKPAEVFDKNPHPPNSAPPETTTKSPEATRSPQTPRPPPSDDKEAEPNQGVDGVGEPGMGEEGGAVDSEVEEKRRKIIEVSCALILRKYS